MKDLPAPATMPDDSLIRSNTNLPPLPTKAASNAPQKTMVVCKDCPRKFVTRRDYNRHRKTHDRPHLCSLCPRKFALKSDLDRHGAQHEKNSARFNCSWPGCSFRGSVRKDNLLKHMNKAHLDQDRTVVDAKQREARKEELLQLYRKSTENEKLHLLQRTRSLAFLEALQGGDEEIVLDRVKTLVNVQMDNRAVELALSETIVMAAKLGYATVVSFLLEKGVPIDAENRDGKTPGSSAASNGQMAVVQLLLDRGLGIDSIDTGSKGTLLYQAAKNGHEVLVRYLLDRRAKVAAGSYWSEPLRGAARGGHKGILRILQHQLPLEAGADTRRRDLAGRDLSAYLF